MNFLVDNRNIGKQNVTHDRNSKRKSRLFLKDLRPTWATPRGLPTCAPVAQRLEQVGRIILYPTGYHRVVVGDRFGRASGEWMGADRTTDLPQYGSGKDALRASGSLRQQTSLGNGDHRARPEDTHTTRDDGKTLKPLSLTRWGASFSPPQESGNRYSSQTGREL